MNKDCVSIPKESIKELKYGMSELYNMAERSRKTEEDSEILKTIHKHFLYAYHFDIKEGEHRDPHMREPYGTPITERVKNNPDRKKNLSDIK